MTWHVGPTGSGNAPCATPDFRTIQAAIVAAAGGDSIVVCPGRYSGPIKIEGHDKDGLTLRAAQPDTVRILSPTKGSRFVDALVDIHDVNDVRLEGMRLVVRGAKPCRTVWTAVRIGNGSRRVTIAGNRIGVADAGKTRLTRGCGYQTGIAGGALVAFNVVEEWGLGQMSGTGIHGTPGSLVIGNTLRFRHPDETTNDWDDIHVGIVANRAWIIGNRILGRSTSSLAGEARGTPIMLVGIETYAEDNDVLVGNVVRYAYNGIDAGGSDMVIGNLVKDSRWFGIEIYGPGGATVARNTVEGSTELDCHEWSAEEYAADTGEEYVVGVNTWLHNIGTTSDPPGLCMPR